MIVTITKDELESLRNLPDKVKLGESSIIREKFILLLDTVESLLKENAKAKENAQMYLDMLTPYLEADGII